MKSFYHAALLFVFLGLSGSPLGAKQVRVATFNIQNGPDAPGTSDYEATKAILGRINADIVGIQEIVITKTNDWQRMGAELGYPHVHLGNTNSSGGLLGYFSRWPLQVTNLSSPTNVASISNSLPPNEFSRRPMRVVVSVPDAAKPLVIWNMHHKANDTNTANHPANQFRRAIEAQRIVQDINAYRSNNPTHDEFVMLGDLNENIFETSGQAVQFTRADYDILRANADVFASSYRLGVDIQFPVLYRAFPDDRYSAAGGGLRRLDLRQQNGTWTGTRGGANVALDYLFVSTALTNGVRGEIYNSEFEPAFPGLPKSGVALATNTSRAASDHFAVFADIQMRDAANNLAVAPSGEVRLSGPAGGPFTPQSSTYTISNPGAQAVAFTISSDASWLVPQLSSGTVAANGSTNFSVSVNGAAAPAVPGEYVGRLTVTGAPGTAAVVRAVRLVVVSAASDYLTQAFTTAAPFDLAFRSLTFTPDGSPNYYRATIGPALAFPVDPAGGTAVALTATDSREIVLNGGTSVALFGTAYARFYIGSSGYLTFAGPDTDYTPSLADHFSRPRISALFFELLPASGKVSYKQLSDRVAVTYQNVPEYGVTGSNNFQIEMFFDGRIRLTWLRMDAAQPVRSTPPIVGLSPGSGLPALFTGSVFRNYPAGETAFEGFVRGEGLDPAGSGAPGEDPDRDGLANWAEFAFGGSPVRGDAALARVGKVGSEMVFSFMARTVGMDYAVEHTADLGASFAPASSITLTTASDQTGVPQGWVRRRFVMPPGTSGFYRIRASEN